MAKSENQKLKMMYLKKMLEEKTDENHPMPMQEIIDELDKYDIKAERKSIYSDIELLNRFGMDIVFRKEQPAGYYVASRDFELAELKLLVDAVQASKFVTEKKSRELIKKLEGQASTYDGHKLQRHVIVANRIKSMNESIFYNVDKIHQALFDNVKISFQYAVWTPEKKLEPKKGGKPYIISPWALTWNEENYYMIGYDEEACKVKHYRVDKMLKIKLTEQPRDGKECFRDFDIAKYNKQTFGMFISDKNMNDKDIVLDCDNDMIGVILDRFGADTSVRAISDNQCRARVRVNVSNQFYAWLCGLGTKVKIAEPADVAEDYRKYLKSIAKMYKQTKE